MTKTAKTQKEPKSPQKSPQKSSEKSGGRNLIILGVVAIIVSLITSGISLAVYHSSGDIYLDRSRPGYLPDSEEIEADTDSTETEYVIEKSGKITPEDLDAYLENLKKQVDGLNSYDSPFSSDSLSDEALGLPVNPPSE